MLEVTDLDDLRNDVATLTGELEPPDDPLLASFDACAALPIFKPSLGGITRAIPDLAKFISAIEEAAGALIESVGEEVPDTLQDRLELIE